MTSTNFLVGQNFHASKYGNNFRAHSRESNKMRSEMESHRRAEHERYALKNASDSAPVPKPPTFTDDQIAELMDAFSLFDTDHTGLISRQYLGMILRSVGMQPTAEELQSDLANIGDRGINFGDVLECGVQYIDRGAVGLELIEAFKEVFDKQKSGYADPAHIMASAHHVGDPLTKAETYKLMEWVGLKDVGKLTQRQKFDPSKAAMGEGLDFVAHALDNRMNKRVLTSSKGPSDIAARFW